MLKLKIHKSFKKDIKRDVSSGHYSKQDFNILKTIIIALQNGDRILAKHKRHSLKGELQNLESIHVKNDWLLIFATDTNFLNLIMLGKHTQVYKKFR